MSLRVRIALLVAVACAAVAAVVGVLGYRSTEERLVDELDQSLEQVSTLIIGVRGQARVPARVVGDVYSTRQVAADGEVLRTNFAADVPVDQDVLDAVSGQSFLRSFDSVETADDGRYRVLTLGVESSALQVARSLDETDNVLDDLRARTVFVVLLTAAVGAVAGALVAGRVAAPLRRLAAAAETVERSGELDVDLGPDAGRDEVGRLRRSFGSMLGALARSRDEQRRLVQDAGHELRTPLTALRTNLAVLRRHGDLPDDVRAEIVDELSSEVDELAELVDELVAAAQGELADEPVESVDVGDLAAAVADRVGRRHGREVTVEVPPAEPTTVRAGPMALTRALTNIVDNACKFDDSGGVLELSVERRTTPDGHVVAVRVADRGPGIPDDELLLVFDRFHRVEATRTMPGSGLGLSIVRDVVERAGGRVVAANRSGGGAEIGFDLPAADPAVDPT